MTPWVREFHRLKNGRAIANHQFLSNAENKIGEDVLESHDTKQYQSGDSVFA